MPTTDHLLAEMAIRQLHVKYADAVWRKDFVAFGDCFAEDCEWRIGGMIMRGREEIVRTFEGIIGHFNRVLLTFRTPILEVGQGTASARTYVNEMTARNTDFGTPPRMPDWDTPPPQYPGFPGQSDSGAPGSGG